MNENKVYALSEGETKLLDIIRQVKYGEVKVPIRNGKIVLAKITIPADIIGLEYFETIQIETSDN